MVKRKCQVILVDMDGTLCQGECFNEEAVLKAKPVQEMIDWVNEISKTNFVVIYTARRDFLLPATLRWLRVNSVSFQAISNNKTPCDLLIDDRAINPKDLLKTQMINDKSQRI